MLGWKAKSVHKKKGKRDITLYYDRVRDGCTVAEHGESKPAVTADSVKRITQILEASEILSVQTRYQAAEVIQGKEDQITLQRINKRRNGKPVSKSLSTGCLPSSASPTMLFKKRPALLKKGAAVVAAPRPVSSEPTMNETFFRRWGHNLDRWGSKDKTVGSTERDTDWWRSNLPSTDTFSVHHQDRSFDNRRAFSCEPHSHPWDDKAKPGTGCSDLHCIHRSCGRTTKKKRAGTAPTPAPLPKQYRKRDMSQSMYGLASRQNVLLSSKSRARLAADQILNGD